MAIRQDREKNMPFVGLGLHFLVAIFCAVHAVRSGQPLYWLIILFSFPLLGSVVYFLVVYLPNSRLERGAMKAVSSAARAMDPGREVRLARADFDTTPTAQNQMRLAAALLEAGQPNEAAQLYESALKGPFASDPDLRFGAARAFVECQRYADALLHLASLQTSRPEYRSDAVALLEARSHAGAGQHVQARAVFAQAVERFGTFEAYAEYAIWAMATGNSALAAELQSQIDKITARWTAATRTLNEPITRRLRAAQQIAKRSATG